MSATANLVVGIKTDSAKQSLRELKAWMQQEMKGLALSVNEAALGNSVQAALKAQKFSIGFDSAALKVDVNRALSEVFSVRQKILIDQSGLTEQIRAAVAAGTAGAKVAAGATVVATGPAGPDIKTTIQQILTPALDELAKAAALVGGTARAIGAGQVSGTSTASSGYSYTNPETGERVSFRRRLANPDQVLAGQILPGNEAVNAERTAARDKAARMSALNAANNLELAQIRREEAENERNQARLRKERAAALNAANNLELAAIRREELEAERNAARLKAERFRVLNAINNLELAAIRREEAEAARASARAQKDRSAALNAANNLELAAIRREEAAAERAAAKQRADAAKAARLEMARFYETAKLEASSTLKGAGPSISAARATAARFGPERTTEFLGSKAGLLSVTGSLDEYEKKAKVAAAANVALRNSMNDAHSAARGFAGSLGALWTTWGSTVPIVAAAAVGGALRSVFTVGKQVEYQLQFVQVLTNGAAVSFQNFGDAVRGSMTAPLQAAEALRGLAQNGLGAREALSALPSILNLATAGELGLAEAALGATGVMAAFNLQVGDLGRISDVFAKAAAISNTSVSAMVESMKQASTVADLYKVSIEEAAAGLAMLAQRNITGTAAGTAYRNMWVELATPTKKAQNALADVGATLFDSNKQLLSSSVVLETLRSKVSVLNEQSKLTFLNDVFGERGAKAANAILNNFDEYQEKLRQIREESKDFTKTVVQALSQTTEGKLKALITEFQLSVATAYNASADSVKNFVDSLRGIVTSEGFTRSLAYLTESVANLSKYLAENAQTVLVTIAAWKAGAWAIAAAQGIMTLVSAVRAAETAMIGFAAVSRTALGVITGIGGLIAILGVEYLLLREKTDAATESQKQFTNALEIERDRLNRSNKAAEDRVRILQLQIKYQQEGMSLSAAREKAEREASTGSVKNFDEQINSRLSKLAQLETRQREIADRLGTADAPTRRGSLDRRALSGAYTGLDAPEIAKLQAEQAKLTKAIEVENNQLNQLYATRAVAAVEANTTYYESEASFQSKRLEQIRVFNDRIRVALRENSKLTISGLTIGADQAPQGQQEFEAFMKAREADLNSRLVNIPRRDPAAAAVERRTDKAEIRGLIDALRQEEEALRQNSRLKREIATAKYDQNEYGPFLAALVSEQQIRSDLRDSFALEAKAITQLTLAKASSRNLDAADRQEIDNQIQRREANIRSIQRDLDARREVDKFTAQARARDRDASDQKMLTGLGVQDDKRLEGIEQKYLLKIIDPVDAARATAVLQTAQAYAKDIAEREDSLARAQRARQTIAEDLNAASEDQVFSMTEMLLVADQQIVREQRILDILRARSSEAQGRIGDAAARNEERSRSATYGLEKFWTDYRNAAESNAKAVYDIMQSTTNSMSGMVERFATTGKLSFRDFARGVAAEATKILANRAIMELLKLGLSIFGGAFGGGGGGTAVNGSAGTGFGGGSYAPTAFSANGNVMTPMGPMPLQKFDAGGIGRSPMVSVFAEGRKPEAYVPLQDGRTIPVTVQGAAGGGNVQVHTEIHVHGDGRASSDSNATNDQAGQLARMIERSTLEIIVREKRAGGVLARV